MFYIYEYPSFKSTCSFFLKFDLLCVSFSFSHGTERCLGAAAEFHLDGFHMRKAAELDAVKNYTRSIFIPDYQNNGNWDNSSGIQTAKARPL